MQDPEMLRRLLRARDRMDAASQEAWPVGRLAKVSGVSEAHFARSFKEAFGVPPHRYLLTRRMERAASMLRDTDLPIIEIALQSGYASLGTFGRTFRDVMGKSPSEQRAEGKASPPQRAFPECYLAAAHRPARRPQGVGSSDSPSRPRAEPAPVRRRRRSAPVEIAVSEKRRTDAEGSSGSGDETEVTT